MKRSNRICVCIFHYGAIVARKSSASFHSISNKKKQSCDDFAMYSIANYLHGKEMELTSLTISSKTNQLKKLTYLPSLTVEAK